MDSITAILTALTIGATEGVRSSAEQAVKDGYYELRALIGRNFKHKSDAPQALEQLEKRPDSEARKVVLHEELMAAGAAEDGELLQRAEAFIALLNKHGLFPSGPQALVVGDGATVAQGSGRAVSAPRGMAIGGDLHGNVYTGPPPKDEKDEKEALAIYRRVLATSCGRLPMRGMHKGAGDATARKSPLGLANVYIDLDTTERVPFEGKGKKRGARGSPYEERDTRPVRALEAAVRTRRLVLLGGPGSGKTTFVRRLAQCIAAGMHESESGRLEELPEWPEGEVDILPVMVTLRDFARSLPDPLPPSAKPKHLWNFIVERLEAQNLSFASPHVERALEKGTAIVLLDGLDEVPSVAKRAFVRDAIAVFLDRYHERNRCLVTCRVLSYQPSARSQTEDLGLPELPSLELAPFDETKIDEFIEAWYAELVRIGEARGEDEPDLVSGLRSAVRRRDLWRLAPNPLLLTVMALVHAHKGRLPDARALLYEETIDLLLWRWEQVKTSDREEAVTLQQLLLEAGCEEIDLRRTLWQLAYENHGRGGTGEGDEKLADIGEHSLEKALALLKDDDRNWAKRMIEAIKLRAGLLIERVPEVYTFPHRTFQEYMAGAHLAAQTNFAQEGSKLAEQAALWREVILLSVGRLVHVTGEIDKPMDLAGELCPAEPPRDDVGWRKVWLSGDVLLEIGLNRVCNRSLGKELLDRVPKKLKTLLEGGKLPAVERAKAGITLARLGDPRFDAASWSLPGDRLLGFREVPECTFEMGSDEHSDSMSYKDERPGHEVVLPTFYMARYLVTVGQFRVFVKDWGHEPVDEASVRGIDNHPVVYITWHEALSYTRWLDGKLKGCAAERLEGDLSEVERRFWDGLLRGELHVTLPSEAEWEKAARGEGGRIYPWGEKADPEKVNYYETKIGGTSTVGCFPGGASPYGCEDMSGNVWEWTRSLWGKDWDEPEHRYPYRADDGREDLGAGSEVLRVLRGGSFFSVEDSVRCAYRSGRNPYLGNACSGFRVVVSPFS